LTLVDELRRALRLIALEAQKLKGLGYSQQRLRRIGASWDNGVGLREARRFMARRLLASDR
jgi:phosphopantothenate synthetase